VPGVELHFDEVVLPDPGAGFGPQTTHATQFLADRVDALPFRHPVPLRVALHTHTGHPRQERDAHAATTLLDAVPGVEVVGTLSSPRLQYHCPTPANAAARQAFDAERAELLSTARELGADAVATLYHSCHRDWCVPAPEALTIRNYISIVAESLGCAAEDRHAVLRRLPDADSTVAASRAQWATHGWSEDDARAAVSALRSRQANEATDNG
jgi:heterodisulfide reductase subunit D